MSRILVQQLTDECEFPEGIDSTMLSSFISCPRSFFYEYLLHFKSRYGSVHLVAGAAFAAGIEAAKRAYWVDKKPSEDAIAEGLRALLTEYGDYNPEINTAKTATNMARALEYYFHEAWPFETEDAIPVEINGVAGLEYSFAEPIDVDHPVTGMPLLYTGRMDAITQYAGGLWGMDEKTTSALGESWVKQWDLRPQFTGYTFFAQRAGYQLEGVLVRGVAIKKLSFAHMQVPSGRDPYLIEQWYDSTMYHLERMKKMWQERYFPPHFGSACENYGGCKFKGICQSASGVDSMATYFSRRKWNPLVREEENLDMTVEESFTLQSLMEGL